MVKSAFSTDPFRLVIAVIPPAIICHLLESTLAIETGGSRERKTAKTS